MEQGSKQNSDELVQQAGLSNDVRTEKSRLSETEERSRREAGIRRYIEQRVIALDKKVEVDKRSESLRKLPTHDRVEKLYEKLMVRIHKLEDDRERQEKDPDYQPKPVNARLISDIYTLWHDSEVQQTFVDRYVEARLDEKEFRISDLGSEYLRNKDELSETNQAYETVTKDLYLDRIEEKDDINDAQEQAGYLASQIVSLREERGQIASLDIEGIEQTSENTDVAARISYETLKNYHEQNKEGFVWLPCYEKNRLLAVQSLQNKRWPILQGEAGSGKSELAASTARFLTGQEMEDVNCDETTGERQLIGTQEMKEGQSYWRYEKAMRAATGFPDSLSDAKRESDTGRILRLDEILRLSDRAFGVIKKLRQLKPGDDFNGRSVLPGFAAIGTANPPGPRYPHSHELNPAMEREFQTIEVDYPPMSGDDPELYDFMVSALMNDEGLIPAAYNELSPAYNHQELATPETLTDGRQVVAKDELNQDPTNPAHGSLYRLSYAIRQVQNSFINGNAESPLEGSLRYKTDSSGAIRLSPDQGDPLKLSHSTITLGEISSWLTAFPERYQKDDASFHVATLTEYISMKLSDYIGKAHPEDRPYLKAIFEHYRLFDDPPDLSSAEPMTPKEIGYLSPRVPRPFEVAEPQMAGADNKEIAEEAPEPKEKVDKLTTTEVMLEDGTGVLIDTASEALSFSQEGQEHQLYPNSTFLLGPSRVVYVGTISSDDPESSRHGQIVLRINEGLHRIIDLDEIIEQGSEFVISIEAVAEILGKENAIGPVEVAKIFNLEIDQGQIPPIPFSREELEKAKEQGQFLIYRPEKTKDGQPITMRMLHENVSPTFNPDPAVDGKDLYDIDWYKNEKFFTTDTSRAGWALVTRETIPDSTDKNYLQQTEILANYAKEIMKGVADPARTSQFQEMIREFESQKKNLDDSMKEVIAGTGDWKKLAQQLSDLKLNQALRQRPVEAFLDTIAYYKNDPSSKTRLLQDRYTWTNVRSSGGHLVFFGRFYSDGDGCNLDSWNPDDHDGSIGVTSSRNL